MKPLKESPLVSIVILTWNSEKFMDTCLESLSKQTYNNFEIIIVDNASTDNTLKRVKELEYKPEPRIIANERNHGCAGGNNIGWKAGKGDIVVFLNPDTVVEKTWLEELVKAMKENPDAAIAGCKIYYPNSHIIQHAGGILHPNGMTDHYGNGEEDTGKYDELKDVDYVTGAAIAVRDEFMKEAGGLDEDYFPAYFEETDLCYRAHRKGYKVLYVPDSVLYHYESPGLTKFSPKFFATYYKMRFRFVVKNYTLKKFLCDFLPFEFAWMIKEPHARGHRLMQLKAYWQGLRYLITGAK